MLNISGVTNANLEGPIAWMVTISILALPYVILGSILLYVLRKRTAPKLNIITLIALLVYGISLFLLALR